MSPYIGLQAATRIYRLSYGCCNVLSSLAIMSTSTIAACCRHIRLVRCRQQVYWITGANHGVFFRRHCKSVWWSFDISVNSLTCRPMNYIVPIQSHPVPFSLHVTIMNIDNRGLFRQYFTDKYSSITYLCRITDNMKLVHCPWLVDVTFGTVMSGLSASGVLTRQTAPSTL